MKILYYSPHPQLKLSSSNGAGTHMRAFIEALKANNHEVLPVVMGDLFPVQMNNSTKTGLWSLKSILKIFIPKIIWRSVKEYRLLQWDRQSAQHLIRQIDFFKPDLVYERAAYMQKSGIEVCQMKKTVHYIELNAPFIEEVQKFENASTLWTKKAKNVEKMQIQLPQKVFVVSSALKSYYSKWTKDVEKIIITPNCVNIDVIKVNNELRNELLTKYPLKNQTVIGFVGSIFPYHGVDVLIHAFAYLLKTQGNIKLMIVGDGQILPKLKKLTRTLGIHDHVIFTDSISHKNVFTYIDLMDITVMARSNWYGSPVKIFEYGAMKKAIIAPNTVPVQDVMVDGVDGILIDANSNSLLHALKILLNDSVYRVKLGETFYQKVVEKYIWEKLIPKII